MCVEINTRSSNPCTHSSQLIFVILLNINLKRFFFPSHIHSAHLRDPLSFMGMMSETGEGIKDGLKMLKSMFNFFLGKNLDKQTCYFFRQRLPYLNSMVVWYTSCLWRLVVQSLRFPLRLIFWYHPDHVVQFKVR